MHICACVRARRIARGLPFGKQFYRFLKPKAAKEVSASAQLPVYYLIIISRKIARSSLPLLTSALALARCGGTQFKSSHFRNLLSFLANGRERRAERTRGARQVARDHRGRPSGITGRELRRKLRVIEFVSTLCRSPGAPSGQNKIKIVYINYSQLPLQRNARKVVAEEHQPKERDSSSPPDLGNRAAWITASNAGDIENVRVTSVGSGLHVVVEE